MYIIFFIIFFLPFVASDCYMSIQCNQNPTHDSSIFDNCHFTTKYQQPQYYLYTFNNTHVELVCVKQTYITGYFDILDTIANCTIRCIPFTLITDIYVTGHEYGYTEKLIRYPCCAKKSHMLQFENETIAIYEEKNHSVSYLNTNHNIFLIYLNALHYVTRNETSTIGVINGVECTINTACINKKIPLTVPNFVRTLTFEFTHLFTRHVGNFNWTNNNKTCFTRVCTMPIDDDMKIIGCVDSYLSYGCVIFHIEVVKVHAKLIPFVPKLKACDANSNVILKYDSASDLYETQLNLAVYEYNNTFKLYRTSLIPLSLFLYNDTILYSYYNVPLIPYIYTRLTIETQQFEHISYTISEFQCNLFRSPNYTLYYNNILGLVGNRMTSIYHVKKGFGIMEIDRQSYIRLIIYDLGNHSIQPFTGTTGTCYSTKLYNIKSIKTVCNMYKSLRADVAVSWLRDGQYIVTNRNLILETKIHNTTYCASNNDDRFNSTICIICSFDHKRNYLSIIIIGVLTVIILFCIYLRHFISRVIWKTWYRVETLLL